MVWVGSIILSLLALRLSTLSFGCTSFFFNLFLHIQQAINWSFSRKYVIEQISNFHNKLTNYYYFFFQIFSNFVFRLAQNNWIVQRLTKRGNITIRLNDRSFIKRLSELPIYLEDCLSGIPLNPIHLLNNFTRKLKLHTMLVFAFQPCKRKESNRLLSPRKKWSKNFRFHRITKLLWTWQLLLPGNTTIQHRRKALSHTNTSKKNITAFKPCMR